MQNNILCRAASNPPASPAASPSASELMPPPMPRPSPLVRSSSHCLKPAIKKRRASAFQGSANKRKKVTFDLSLGADPVGGFDDELPDVKKPTPFTNYCPKCGEAIPTTAQLCGGTTCIWDSDTECDSDAETVDLNDPEDYIHADLYGRLVRVENFFTNLGPYLDGVIGGIISDVRKQADDLITSVHYVSPTTPPCSPPPPSSLRHLEEPTLDVN